MRAIMTVILMIVLSVASATAGIRHYFDYLGSIRAIVNTDGEVEQTVDYLSTGIPIKGGTGEIIDDRLHTGKQYLSLNGNLLYDNVARYYSPVHGRFITPDALSSDYPHISHYAHCANNPLSIIDPTGNYLESAWDAVNIGLGISSLWNNIKKGNVGAAIVDGVGVVVDAVAMALPVVPGGASSFIKAARAADDVVDITQTSKNASKFNSRLSTTSKSSNEALRKAKDQNGIPRSQQPDKTIKAGTPEGDKVNLRPDENIQLYEYTNSKGEKIQIRQDKAKMYKDGGEQSPHYNAGKKGEKLKQHHCYEN